MAEFGLCFFFFFQAEDGIRDLYVTGVQTCALPISNVESTARRRGPRGRRSFSRARSFDVNSISPMSFLADFKTFAFKGNMVDLAVGEIGRASCRERV